MLLLTLSTNGILLPVNCMEEAAGLVMHFQWSTEDLHFHSLCLSTLMVLINCSLYSIEIMFRAYTSSSVILKDMFLCQIYKGITHLTLQTNADKGRQTANLPTLFWQRLRVPICINLVHDLVSSLNSLLANWLHIFHTLSPSFWWLSLNCNYSIWRAPNLFWAASVFWHLLFLALPCSLTSFLNTYVFPGTFCSAFGYFCTFLKDLNWITFVVRVFLKLFPP